MHIWWNIIRFICGKRSWRGGSENKDDIVQLKKRSRLIVLNSNEDIFCLFTFCVIHIFLTIMKLLVYVFLKNIFLVNFQNATPLLYWLLISEHGFT